MYFGSKTATSLIIAALILAPVAFVSLPGAGVAYAAGQSRAPNVIGTTLAFLDGKVVTVQYSNIYFCNSAGPATNASSSPCVVGIDATTDPVPDVASNLLDVIIPYYGPNIFDPSLGANNLTQCPDNISTLTCPNHPNFLDLTPTGIAGVVPLPIHSHVLTGNGGGWWKLRIWLITDGSIFPNPNTGACAAGTGCVTSLSALDAAVGSGKAVGPVPTTIYLFFNVVSSNSK